MVDHQLETAMRVAAGAVARKILGSKISINAAVTKIGEIDCSKTKWDFKGIKSNPFSQLTSKSQIANYVDKIRKMVYQ